MKKNEVKIGGEYAVKVNGRIARVRVTRLHSNGGWMGVNTATGREIRIRTAAKLRYPWGARPARKPAVVNGMTALESELRNNPGLGWESFAAYVEEHGDFPITEFDRNEVEQALAKGMTPAQIVLNFRGTFADKE